MGRSCVAAAGAAMVLVGSFFIVTFNASSLSQRSNFGEGAAAFATREDISTSVQHSLKIFNEYASSGATRPSYPWRFMAEPHRDTTFRIQSSTSVGGSKEETAGQTEMEELFSWNWSVEPLRRFGSREEGRRTLHGVASGEQREQRDDTFAGTTSHNFIHVFSSPGRFRVLASRSTFDKSEEAVVIEEDVIVKYVRREIRLMTSTDRDRLLRAMYFVYTVRTSEGVERLQDTRYRGIEYFIREHLHGGADRACDHWHDDAGIMTHHVGFTMEFEKVLQVVDPTVTVPYWDYTIDSYRYCTPDSSFTCWREEILQKSPLFWDDWFGAGSPDTVDHAVHQGLWGNVTVFAAAGNYSSITNPYGLLRSPWNTDSTLNALRRSSQVDGFDAMGMVSCSDWQRCFESKNLATMNTCLNGEVHGPIHILLGGQWHTNLPILNNSAIWSGVGDGEGANLAGEQLLFSKLLWRSGYLRCPESCSADTSSEDCVCSCPTEYRHGRSPYEILAETGLLYYISTQDASKGLLYNKTTDKYGLVGYTLKEEEETWNRLLNSVCDPGHPGEMYTSAAPYDPVFWLLHPASERLLNWRRMLKAWKFADFDEAWGYNHSSVNAPSDVGKVFNWENTSGFDLPTHEMGTCPGHEAMDLLPFKGLIKDGEYATNKDFYEFLHPWNEMLPYTYDSYRWEHCNASGDDIGWDLLPRGWASDHGL